MLQGIPRQVGARVHVEFVHHMRTVGVDRLSADSQPGRNLRVTVTLGYQAEYIALPLCQHAMLRQQPALSGAEQPEFDRVAAPGPFHHQVALRNGANRAYQVSRSALLEDKARGTRSHRAEQVLLVL